jgi:hypothetical protein
MESFVRSHRRHSYLLLALLAFYPTTAFGTQSVSQGVAYDTDRLYQGLILICSQPNAPRTDGDWQAMMKSMGFRPTAQPARWRIDTPRGEIQAAASFVGTASTFSIQFSANSAELMPEPILAHFLRTASYVSVGTDGMELGLESKAVAGVGIVRGSILIGLTGRFLGTLTNIERK